MRTELALKQATFGHVAEWLPGAKAFNMHYSAPNHWRVEPEPSITEATIGRNAYMVTAAHMTHLLPTRAAMVARTVHIHLFDATNRTPVRSTLR